MIINVVTTIDDKERLELICRELLEKKLVACAQILGPIKSIYRWNGVLEETEEWMGLMKTRIDLYDAVEKEIKALHPYELPEIAALDVTHILSAYGQWVIDETATK